MFQHTASLSNYQIFQPVNTGSPRWDLYSHLSRLPQTARIDFEDHSLAGNLIIRIEPDLGSAGEREAEAKIVSVPYATRALGNTEDAIEFIRCVNLIAGTDARAFNLQIIASYFYGEARTRPVREVLKEMALLALEMTAVLARRLEEEKGEYLFPGRWNKDVPIVKVNNGHAAALRRSGVRQFRLYDLRHTWATRAAMAGVDLVTLAAMLGHSRVQMVMRYAHPTEEHQFNAMKKVQTFVAGGLKSGS